VPLLIRTLRGTDRVTLSPISGSQTGIAVLELPHSCFKGKLPAGAGSHPTVSNGSKRHAYMRVGVLCVPNDFDC
jgi:hypothetical protein